MIDENLLRMGDEGNNIFNEALPLLTIDNKNASGKATPLEKESARFKAFLRDIYDFEEKLKEIASQKDIETTFFNTKCLPEIILFAETKLQFLLKAERIYEAKPKKAKKEIITFCEFVGVFAADVMQYNTKLLELQKKYLTIQMQQQGKKEKESIKKDPFGSDDLFDNIDIGNDDFMDEANKKYEEFNKENSKEEKLNVKNISDVTSISINELFKSLAKSLHPDLEKDEAVRAIKVNLMQDLSEAKNNQDLFAMFRLQQKASIYLKKDATINLFSIDKIKSFNATLKKKLDDCKKEFNRLVTISYYRDENGFLQKKTTAKMEKMLKKQVNTTKKVNKAIKSDVQFMRDYDDLEEFIDTFMYYQDY